MNITLTSQFAFNIVFSAEQN